MGERYGIILGTGGADGIDLPFLVLSVVKRFEKFCFNRSKGA